MLPSKPSPSTPRVGITAQIIGHLPEGRRIARFEGADYAVLAVVDGPIDAQFLAELAEVSQAAADHGTGERHRGGPAADPPPSAL